MKIIGLTGPAGSGKDTVARFLCDTQGFVQIAFADPIRAGVKAMFPMLTDEHFTDRTLKETVIPDIGKSPRELMQSMGDYLRHLDPDMLLILIRPRVQKLLWESSLSSLHIAGIVVSDVRKDNEAAYLRKAGEVWHLHRTTMAYTGLASNTRLHNTEEGIQYQSSDRIIHNDGSLDYLYETVANVFSGE
jgi:hypothetical protein